MSANFQPIQLLKDISAAGKTGYLQVEANSVNWNIYFVEGRLQYADHSLQSLETIKHYLMGVAPDVATKITPLLVPDSSNKFQLISIANQLVNRNYLNSNQKTILIRELTQDALESLLWLTNGKFEWNSVNPLEFLNRRSSFDENPLELAPVLASLQIRLQKWQKLSPLITSPYQRPLCVNPSLLEKKVPSGNLSPAILNKLVSLMRGLTIRQLGLFLKQDDLKLAQLLFPYVQQGIIKLQSPKSPFDRLPPIPIVQLNSQLSVVKLNSVIPSTTVTSLKSAPTSSPLNSSNVSLSPSKSVIQERESQQKIYRIVCIDDSPTMLDIIKNYLGNEKYQILTIENPMQSVAYLFDSKPDLILMDFSMPGINGNRLCQILKSSSVFQNVPIIMISANAKMLDKEKIQAAGATDFLAKPFTQESLLVMVNNYLEKAR